jgi:hypothetical protein
VGPPVSELRASPNTTSGQRLSVHVPPEHVGAVLTLCQERRGVQIDMKYLTNERVVVIYELPFNEIIFDFHDRLKSVTRGYASMDYEVMMLGRIKEAYDQHHDNERAVSEGLAHTGGLITSAAAIMVAVFGAFALGRVVLIQAVGFGMALAVALDATLVRVLLVPATMRLFGDLNWWLPAPLVRLRHALGFGPGRGGHG